MEETALAKTVIRWLENKQWDVYQEVELRRTGRADIVAVREGKIWAIECKTSLNLAVLEQAWRWETHFRSIAVPKGKRGDREFAYRLAKSLKLGVIESDGYSRVWEILPPVYMPEYDHIAKKYLTKLLPEHKVALAAGSNGGGYVTQYGMTIKKIRNFVRANPGCTLKEIVDGVGKGHYANPQSARSCLKNALSDWEAGWCQIVEIEGKAHYYCKPDFQDPY